MFFNKRKKEKAEKEKQLLYSIIKSLENSISVLEMEDSYLRASVIFLSKYSIKDIVFSIKENTAKIEYFTNTGYKTFTSEDKKIIAAIKNNTISTGYHDDKKALVMIDGDIYTIDKDNQTIRKYETLNERTDF